MLNVVPDSLSVVSVVLPAIVAGVGLLLNASLRLVTGLGIVGIEIGVGGGVVVGVVVLEGGRRRVTGMGLIVGGLFTLRVLLMKLLAEGLTLVVLRVCCVFPGTWAIFLFAVTIAFSRAARLLLIL